MRQKVTYYLPSKTVKANFKNQPYGNFWVISVD